MYIYRIQRGEKKELKEQRNAKKKIFFMTKKEEIFFIKRERRGLCIE